MTKTETLIIGAGPCGLALGKKLALEKKDFLIVEKSRGVGGRIATRRIDGDSLDHGAPVLKEYDELSQLIDTSKAIRSGGNIYIPGGMTGPFKNLAASLPIQKEVKIVKLERTSHWLATSDQGLVFEADNVVLTAPLPQALELLEQSNIRFESELKKVQYSKALMGLFIIREENFMKPNLPSGVHSLFSMKDRGLSPKAFVMRMDPEYSDKNFGSEESQILKDLEQTFLSAFESIPHINHRELKKWRYVLPLTSIENPYLEAAPQLYLAGDAFLYPDIRGALLSAEALAKKLI